MHRLIPVRIPLLPIATLILAMQPGSAAAQARQLTASDSALVLRILDAEDRRDTTDQALALGRLHIHPRVTLIARRAWERIRDPLFVARDSMPDVAAPPSWPEPGWRLRYRALANQRQDCDALASALLDMSWRVRLRASDLLAPACAGHDSIAARLRGWIDGLPGTVHGLPRPRDSVSWHAAAHGIVALAKVRPGEARPRARRLAGHGQWQVRMYAARAAAQLSDTTTLRALARDPDDNVREVAIEGLARLTSHADDSIYVAALASHGAQAVRAAALALRGSPSAAARATASRRFEEFVARANMSERDARHALLLAAGHDTTEDRPPPRRIPVPHEAVDLALGADIRLRVIMSDTSRAGSFVVRLRGDIAPIMAARILRLARSGYYDGLMWQRVEHDFVVQGGGPGANEYVGHPEFLRDELGRVPHARGTIGMSTRGHDTGDAQWFINLRDNPRLGRDYTVFAEVVEGIGVVDGILEGDVIQSIVEIREAGAAPGPVEVYLSTGDLSRLLQRQPDLRFGTPSRAALPVVEVDPSRTFQRMVGFGASLTDASTWLIVNSMSAPQREELLRDLFGPEPGAGFSFTRVDMGASDFSLRHYSYDDMPPGQRDPTLARFSIAPDRAETIPILRRALAINPRLSIMASPWSPPGWMKTTDSMIKGTLREDAYDAFAEYFRKFIAAYGWEGIPLFAITVQNEPHYEPADYPGMRLEPPARARFAGRHLGPLLASSGIRTQILDWDHNWDEPGSPIQVLSDTLARRYIAGVAWHCYGGDVGAQSVVHDAFPDKDAFFTECSGGEWAPSFAENLLWTVRHLVIGSTRHWSRGVLMWNLALDTAHGPHLGGCGNCRGVVTIANDGSVTRNEEYYALAHASRFVRPGAWRIASTTDVDGIETVAFLNHNDRSIVVVAANQSAAEKTFLVRSRGREFRASLPAMSVATFRWR